MSRGRPPRRFMNSGGTEFTLAEIGISRQRASRAQALASIPEDEFEAMLAATGDGKHYRRALSVTRLANVGRGLAPDHRYGRKLTEALRAAQQLSAEERRALCVAILTTEEAAHVYAALVNLSREVAP